MKNGMSNEHLSAERLQAFLEGELPRRKHARVEEHLTGCARCSAECATWRVLFQDLDDLISHQPHEGFGARVMAGVRIPEPLPFAARVRKRLGEALPTPVAEHVGQAVLQDFLDGVLGRREVAMLESHLAECTPCAVEADSWLALLRRLEGLERFAPTEGFSQRVMTEVRVGEAVPLTARVRARVAALLPASSDRHLDTGRLHDFLDGMLPARQMARVTTHLGACQSCTAEVDGWRALLSQLDDLERLDPGRQFAERVMAGVRIPVAVAAAEKTPLWSQALATAYRFVPQTRRAWAAISGVAVTPAVIAGVVLYAVFSHPNVTPGTLASFVWWRVTDLATLGLTTLSSAALESAQIFGIYSLFEALLAAPLLLTSGLLAYSLLNGLALRVLYKNLIANRPMDGRYAHVSAS